MSQGPIAYVVTSGSYSDYHIDAVFSTREQAEEYARWIDGPNPHYYGGARVEEYEMDEPVPKTGRWEVSGSLREWLDEDPTDRGDGWWEPDSTEKTHASREPDGSIWISAFGKDKERAIRSGRQLARSIKAGTYIVPSLDSEEP